MEIIRLSPQDPLPEQAGSVVVMRQFAEDDPNTRLIAIEIVGDTRRTVIEGDDDAALDRGVETARAQARARGAERVFVIDRTASPIAQAAVTHHGDRTTQMDRLQDTDEEDGVAGPDMRDRRPG